MHPAAYRFIEQHVPEKYSTVLELGGRFVNTSIRPLFPKAKYYWSIDIAEGKEVDEVFDAATYQPNFEPDVVVCCEVLEHVGSDKAKEIVYNAVDMLKPGATLLITAAGPFRPEHSGIDGNALRPEEIYENLWPDRLERWLRTRASFFSYIEIHHNIKACDIYARLVL